MANFWKQLNTPFFALAPMADVTDPAFRRIITKYGKPDVTWTEFVSADGLCHPAGRDNLIKDLAYTEAERPIVAQLFSSNPENMRKAAQLCAELGFDGVDINMGCPDRTIEKQGCGSAMIKTPDKAVEIIRAAKQGISDAGKEIPVSVKTRVGYNTEIINEWIPVLLNESIAALTIHARTRKDLSQVPANWNYVMRVVALRNKLAPETVILGNGDVVDRADGLEKAATTGCDGIMIGRAVFGNPWIFNTSIAVAKRGNWRQGFLLRLLPHRWSKRIQGDSRYTVAQIPLAEKLRVMVEHSQLFCELLPHKNFAVMKKHYKAYAHGFPGAKDLRVALMEAVDVESVKGIVEQFLKNNTHELL
ncbi:MAG: tRNA-dihydrouridine synthase [bacterium]